jgi:hypothetical protein
MKINTKEVPLELLKNKLLLEADDIHFEYNLGFTRFVEEFFTGLEVFNVIDAGEVSTSACSEHAIERVQRYCKSFVIYDERLFYQGTIDACEKTFQMLELAYSNIQAA